MKNFTKKYQLWTSADGGYTFMEFDTLAECISAPKYSDWYITKWVQLAVTEANETPVPVMPHMFSDHGPNTRSVDMEVGKVDEITDVDKEYERRQLGGPIAKLES